MTQSQLTSELNRASEALSKLTTVIQKQDIEDPTKIILKTGVSRELFIINRQLQRLVFNALTNHKLTSQQKTKKAEAKAKRNKEICDKLEAGVHMKKLAQEYELSPSAISIIALSDPDTKRKTRHNRRKLEVGRRLAAGDKAADIANDLGITVANVHTINARLKKESSSSQKEVNECPPKKILKITNPTLSKTGQPIETVWRFPVQSN